MKRFARFLLALAREISDESAYHRHLRQSGATHSGPEWRKFSDARMRQKYSRAKCC
jgi:hypothetical protein